MTKYTLASPFQLPITDGSTTYDPKDKVKGRVYPITKLPFYFHGTTTIDVNGLAERTIEATRENPHGYTFKLAEVTDRYVRIEVSHRNWPMPLIFGMPSYRPRRDIAKNTIGVVWELDRVEQVPFLEFGGAIGFMHYIMGRDVRQISPYERFMPTR